MSTEQRFASVWDAVTDTSAEAESLKVRSALMQAVTAHVEYGGGDPAEAARALGVTDTRLRELLDGCIDRFTADDLVALAVAAGLRVEITVSSPDKAA